ncbi:EVE domain-containing protein [Acidovorax sp. Leaf78]|uniref:EVE domain-containing protein n=1 Tax=unclassified Acidovorax TaxID=2684926 RepID=UPI0009EAFFEC|nr:EVE domain-containing protein [Acidovorax sp. Leaf78]RZJ51692.1 MAG: EVE domain-containing protein [Acidovorax sp.]
MQHALWADAPVITGIARPSRQAAEPNTEKQLHSPRNWIAVASAEHARRGCAVPGAGYMQVCHGKVAPLQRVQAGDRVAYYASALTMGGSDRVQAFVSIGTVLPGAAYAFDMGSGFVPYRKDVAYVPDALEAPIRPLLAQLEFVEDLQRWGAKFRFGLFAISDHDMRVIALAMGASEQLLHF